MTILLINKFFFPQGGAESHFFALRSLLQEQGHTVVDFSLRHPDNVPSPYADFFVSPVDFSRVRFDMQGVRAFGRMLFSFEARRRLERLLRSTKPDIAHIHNLYHHLSPSILPILKKHGIPVVMTVHDFHLVSPNYLLYAHGRRLDPDQNLLSFVASRNIKDSLVATLADTVAFRLHKAMRLYERNVDLFLCGNRFSMDLLRRHRSGIRRMELLAPFFTEPAEPPPAEPGAFALFVGRLSEEKGVDDLLQALAGTNIPFHIAGTGPELQRYQRVARERGLDVTFLGHLAADALTRAYRACRFVVIPSRCYETGPLVAFEAMRSGKPIIVPDHGGFPELVQQGTTGRLSTSGSVASLREAMLALWSRPALCTSLGQAAAQYAGGFTKNSFSAKLSALYASLIPPSSRSPRSGRLDP